MVENFFDKQTPENKTKTDIVEKFFIAWARVIGGHQKSTRPQIDLGYVDLFSGPGKFDDGNESTPLRILRAVLTNSTWRSSLISVFNEALPELRTRLEANIRALPDIHLLKHKPIVTGDLVDKDFDKFLAPVRSVPTLFFVDPWGYIGVNQRLLKDAIGGFGRDVVFFFNYKRVNAALSNPDREDRMEDIFGSRLESLLEEIAGLHHRQREEAIIDALCAELSKNVARYVQTLRFLDARGDPSHYLFALCKNIKGHEIMTNIMAGMSSGRRGSVATFEYWQIPQKDLFADVDDQIPPLVERLKREFAGRQLSVRSIYEEAAAKPCQPYQLTNYKEALKRLEERNEVVIDPPAAKRRRGTLADRCIVTFARQKVRTP